MTLGNRAKKALIRIGDIICPENEDFPSYSTLGAIEYVDSMVIYAPENDIKDLNLLLSILSFTPKALLQWIIYRMSNTGEASGFIPTTFRQLNFGFRGLIFSSYYCGKRPQGYKGKLPSELIKFSINRIEN